MAWNKYSTPPDPRAAFTFAILNNMKESFSQLPNKNEGEYKKNMKNVGLGAAALAACISAASPETAKAQDSNDSSTHEMSVESNIDISRPAAELEKKDLVNILNTHELGNIVRGGSALVTSDMDRDFLEMLYNTLQKFALGFQESSSEVEESKQGEKSFSLDLKLNDVTIVNIERSTSESNNTEDKDFFLRTLAENESLNSLDRETLFTLATDSEFKKLLELEGYNEGNPLPDNISKEQLIKILSFIHGTVQSTKDLPGFKLNRNNNR